MIPPDHACRVNSLAGFSDHGPSRPNGVIAVTVRCGCARRIPLGPKCSATDDPRDQMTASADASNSDSDSICALLPISTTTLRCEACRKLNSAPSASGGIGTPEADHLRSGSPSWDSTLTTSAPASVSSLVQ